MAMVQPNNNGTLTGRIATKDIKLNSNGNSNVCRIAMAVDKWVPKDKRNDPNVEKNHFLPLVFFGDDAKNIAQYGKAGKWIQVVYHLGVNKWQKEGVKHSDIEIVVDAWNFMNVVSGSGQGNSGANANANANTSAAPGEPAPVGEGFYQLDDEELPFNQPLQC